MLTVLALLARRAQETPDAPALIAVGRAWSFQELRSAVEAVARRLRAEGIRPRALVAIHLPAALDWITTLALLSLAARSVSVDDLQAIAGLPIDAVVVRAGSVSAPAPLVIGLREEDLRPVGEETPEGARIVLFARADATCRVILTSGTTGRPSAAALSVAAFEHRISAMPHYWTDRRIELNAMSLATTGGFHTAAACIVNGTPYLAIDRVDRSAVDLAQRAGVEVLAGSPVQLGMLLAVLREHPTVFDRLGEVRLAGASPTSSLLTEIRGQLGVPVRSVYGSTEGGGIAARMLEGTDDPQLVGTLIPGVELEIVDEDGAPVPLGSEGRIRYRGRGVASGYLGGDPSARFSRGWFAPGDAGRLTDEGRLVLGGRESEIVNIGGVKIDPAMLDETVAGFPGVADAAGFGLERTPGVSELALAVVPTASGVDLPALDAHLRRLLPGRNPTVVGRVTAIPRTSMGKVARAELRDEFLRRLGARAATADPQRPRQESNPRPRDEKHREI